MATRGTILFTERDGTEAEVYVHWDMYPQGMADYLYQTLRNPSKGSFATQFIRAVGEAELTTVGDHSDSNFHYAVDGSDPKCMTVSVFSQYTEWTDPEDESSDWTRKSRLLETTDLLSFVNRELKEIREPLERLHIAVEGSRHLRLGTKEELEAEARRLEAVGASEDTAPWYRGTARADAKEIRSYLERLR